MDVQHVIHVTDQVYGSNREKIGTVAAVSPHYLHVTSGFFGLGHDYYIPYDAVQEVEPGTVVLKVPASRIPDLHWEQQPGEPAWVAPLGYYGTMPTSPVQLTPLAPAPPPESAAAPPSEMPTGELPGARAPRGTVPPESVIGHKLCDAHGKHVGNIKAVDHGFAKTSTGLFGLGHRFYVPLDQITRCTGDCCYVNMTDEQIKAQDWTHQPGER